MHRVIVNNQHRLLLLEVLHLAHNYNVRAIDGPHPLLYGFNRTSMRGGVSKILTIYGGLMGASPLVKTSRSLPLENNLKLKDNSISTA